MLKGTGDADKEEDKNQLERYGRRGRALLCRERDKGIRREIQKTNTYTGLQMSRSGLSMTEAYPDSSVVY